jgi:hypothetical protein
MSSAAAVVDRLADTRAELDGVSEQLLTPTPDAVDRCSALLQSASRRLADFRAEGITAQGDAGALEEAWKVRRSFLRAAKLLENAGRFHDNWAAIRGAMTGGYTSRGEPAPVRHPGRLCLEA